MPKPDDDTTLDLEAIRRAVYPLMAYNFRGSLGLNRVINEHVPALIAEVERLRTLAGLTGNREIIGRSDTTPSAKHSLETEG